MIITCPGRLAEMMRAAVAQDEERLRRAKHVHDETERQKLIDDADACRTLLLALAARLAAESVDNSSTAWRPRGAEGCRMETVLSEDFAPRSVFFREIWCEDGSTRPVTTYRDVTRVKWPDGSEDAFCFPTDELVKTVEEKGGTITRTTEPTNGMCGGIIYHRKSRDGVDTGFGSWSTHT